MAKQRPGPQKNTNARSIHNCLLKHITRKIFVVSATRICLVVYLGSLHEPMHITLAALQFLLCMFTSLRFEYGDTFFLNRCPARPFRHHGKALNFLARLRRLLFQGYGGLLLTLLPILNGTALLSLAYTVDTWHWFDVCYAGLLAGDVMVLGLVTRYTREKRSVVEADKQAVVVIRYPYHVWVARRWIINNTACLTVFFGLLCCWRQLWLSDAEFAFACKAVWLFNLMVDFLATPECYPLATRNTES